MNYDKKNKVLRTYLVFFWKPLVWGIIIIILSLLSGNTVDKISPFHFKNADKIVHFIMYFVFSFFLMDGFIKLFSNSFRHKKITVIVFTLSVLFGSIMEVLQILLIQNRTGEILDFAANTLGIIVSIALFQKIQLFLNKLFPFLIKS